MRRLALVLVALAIVPAAGAKEGVVARLENPAVLRSPGGTHVTLRWTLRAGKQPFTASGIYVRLNGGRDVPATEISYGRFRARLRIPLGGVRSIVIALQGVRTDATGSHRSDYRFPIVNDPTR